MKQSFNHDLYRNRFAKFKPIGHATCYSCAMLLILLFTASCEREQINPQPGSQNLDIAVRAAEVNVVKTYTSLAPETAWQLQQARAATARYRDIKNAIRDGYSDINVVVENMGQHFMKADHLDATFDMRKPEILVYNKNDEGAFELVAVEYAIPLTLSEYAPEGFSGDLDVWNENAGFGLWLLHAWVWAYNPDGVFNPTNPLVHLH